MQLEMLHASIFAFFGENNINWPVFTTSSACIMEKDKKIFGLRLTHWIKLNTIQTRIVASFGHSCSQWAIAIVIQIVAVIS